MSITLSFNFSSPIKVANSIPVFGILRTAKPLKTQKKIGVFEAAKRLLSKLLIVQTRTELYQGGRIILYDIGNFLIALGEIPGLSFLKKFGRKLTSIGYKSDRIINSGKRLKKRIKKKDDDKEA